MRFKIERKLMQYPSIHAMKQCLGLDIKHSIEFMSDIYVNSDTKIGELDAVEIKDVHKIFTKICLETGSNKGKLISKKDALKIFCEKSGVESINSSIELSIFTLKTGNRRVNINNCFKIEGDFKITDSSKFKEALDNGVGSKGSYGFGCIVVDK